MPAWPEDFADCCNWFRAGPACPRLAQELGCSVIRISQLTDVLVRARCSAPSAMAGRFGGPLRTMAFLAELNGPHRKQRFPPFG